MNVSINLRLALEWFNSAVVFFKNHFLKIISLALLAAFGRAVQLGAFGEISAALNIFLEIIVESSRLLIFLYTVGLTNVKTGLSRIIQIFTNKSKRSKNWKTAMQTLKFRWGSVILNLVAFVMVAYLINSLIDYAAYQTCMFYKLKQGNIISKDASEWVLLLFFKNISVIPFTLIFNAVFLLWITNKLNMPFTKTAGLKT